MLSQVYIGIIMALFSAICAAATQATLSKPIVTSETRSVAFLTIIIGLVISGSLTFVTESLRFIQSLTPEILLIFAGVGLLQYGISRSTFYTAIKNLGANVTAPIVAVGISVGSILLALLVLREHLTEIVAIGIVTVITGMVLLEGRKAALLRGGNSRAGYVAAVIAATIPAFTTIMISYGLSIYHYVFASVFISFTTASVYYLATQGTRPIARLVRSSPRNSLILFSLAGVFAISTQILRAGALSYAPVVIATPFLTSSNLFIPLMTWMIAKDVEVFNARTVIGIVIITVGLILVTL